MVLSVVVVIILLLLPSASLGADCSLAEQAMKDAMRIRGLEKLSDVPCQVQSRSEVEAYVRRLIEDELTPERIDAEERIYRILGTIPLDYDYKEGLISLYASQVGGYYDQKKDFYVMADWIPEQGQLTVTVHELVHALQDQHFQLDTFLDPDTFDTDELLARSALIEGDATAVMADYLRGRRGMKPLAEDPRVSPFFIQTLLATALGENNAPPALQNTLIFPYASGLQFVHFMLRQGGYPRINAIFSRLPRSTEEILHPEKYTLEEPDFRTISPDDFDADLREKVENAVEDDRLGEFFISSTLGAHLGPHEASRASSGWAGDRVFLLNRKGRFGQLLWLSYWDSIEDAREFIQALESMFVKRFLIEAQGPESKRIFQATAVGKVTLIKRGKSVLLQVE